MEIKKLGNMEIWKMEIWTYGNMEIWKYLNKE